MRVTKEKWSSEDQEEGGKLYKRSILSAELYEISPVAFPAYPANDVSVRSLDDFRESQNEQRARELENEIMLLEIELDLIG
ncbi:Caudovirus prohead protease [compost metagenome]